MTGFRTKAALVLERMSNAMTEFFLRPASPLPLACLRISLALILLVQAYFVQASYFTLFSRSGLLQGPLTDALRNQPGPRIAWLAEHLPFGGATEAQLLTVVGIFYVIALMFLLVGFFSRAAAFTAWLLHWLLMVTGESSAYGLDAYTHFLLFYMVWMPVGDALALDLLPTGGVIRASWQARLSLRVLQLHLCLSYFASALEKLSGEQWWTGEVMWRALNLPLFARFDLTWIANWPSLLFAATWMTLIFEGAYFIFIWPRATRRLWLAGIVGLHFGIAVFLGLHLFGLMMCSLSLCAFGVSAEPAIDQTPVGPGDLFGSPVTPLALPQVVIGPDGAPA